MIISNISAAPDRLFSVSSPVSERVEVHRTSIEDAAVRMRRVADGVSMPAGGTAEFSPGELHLMIVQLKHSLREGRSVTLTLVFERAGATTALMSVMTMGASSLRN